MPFQVGGVAVHDDTQHSGSAKRGQASGVAPLDATSLVPDANIPSGITRDTELAAHEADTTGIHGITDTSLLGILKTGSYVGDGTQNRAIAHGLGAVPKWVIVIETGVAGTTGVILAAANLFRTVNSAADYIYTSTAWTTTNFYVGMAAGTAGNENTYNYQWIAFG